MKKVIRKTFLAFLGISMVFVSCNTEQEEIVNSVQSVEERKSQKASKVEKNSALDLTFSLQDGEIMHQDFIITDLNAVNPSECGSTPFNQAINESVQSNLDLLGLDYYDLYTTINRLYTFIDEDKQYFGAEGEYTNFIKKQQRSLENFWSMPNEITVKGQHNSTLNDRDKIALVYIVFAGLPEVVAYSNADFLLAVNEASTFLNESPLLSFDGFASSTNLIVIGDGLVELMVKSGVEDRVVWNGILAHEWAHQIQFDNYAIWYPDGAADNEPEATRTTELEADFFAAYYMAHKRGATYNWKRVEEFFELFFNIGDCSFTSDGHHGTPLQRMEAARLGFELAKNTFPKGKVLSKDEVHASFLSVLNEIVD